MSEIALVYYSLVRVISDMMIEEYYEFLPFEVTVLLPYLSFNIARVEETELYHFHLNF